MLKLKDRLEEAKNEVLRLERAMLSATCLDAGHDWKSIGGTNAGCCRDCGCSVPVLQCTRCGDSDYGFNDEASDVRAKCFELNGSWED